jgi:GNAT superfamily N-acetyltransferase
VSGLPDGVRVRAVDAATGRALRMAVLRPDEPPGSSMYAKEDDPATVHVAVLEPAHPGVEPEDVLAVGSVMAEPHPRDPRAGDWRVRGMATRPDLRGCGLGMGVLRELEAAARQAGAARLWCNARTPAAGFYERAGWRVEGKEFEIAGIGSHLLMSTASS